MKAIKRNAVIVTVMLFIGAAVYLNWSYNKRVEKAAKAGDGAVDTLKDGGDVQETGPAGAAGTPDNLMDEGDAGLYYTVNGGSGDAAGAGSGDGEYGEYFAQVRLERSEARDQAAATLTAVAEAEGASQETVDGALRAMTELAQRAVKESELESQIRAKGFIDCVVYLSDQGAKVTVAREGGLDQISVAQITDVIVSGTGLTPDKLTVSEIK